MPEKNETQELLSSDADSIRESIWEGEFSEMLKKWEIDDLAKLGMEVKRKKLIAEITDAAEDDILSAIRRLGWSSDIVRELKTMKGGG